MINTVLSKVFGTKHDRDMKLVLPVVAEINSLEKTIKALSDAQLQGKTGEMKQKLANGAPLDSLLPEAFAVCREAAHRVLGMRHYDVQLIGGVILHRGNIAEMRTGEGKTLVATLPVFLNGLSGLGAHVVTVNDYLATRDCEWMGRLYNWMGLSTGIIVHDLSDRQRQQSYGADITYGTNNEFGFDYLRDNMKFDIKDYVQRPHNFAIVDECDSILIDEARTPLIISGPAENSTDKYYIIDRIIPHLKREIDFVMEEKTKTASLTDEGNTHVEKLLEIDNLYDAAHIDLLHHVYQALKAHNLYRRDVEYMVKDGEVIIVDEFTGRLMPGRRWSDGLHQAIEAKEGVEVKNENQTLATITFQNYFRMYKKLSGMTGTADTEAIEFQKIYKLEVIVIPTNKPMIRKDHEDVVFKTEAAKYKSIAQDIKKRNDQGQPVLVGTVSIEKSERLSDFLKGMNVPHNVLNAKHHEREAEIVAQAGSKGAVTIATNMAGRGTDILLGGNPEFLAKAVNSDQDSPEHKEALVKFSAECALEKKEVLAAGGLCIIGTERHESRRIDNQLRGRSGRQGDPGASQFYLSLEDNLMRIFNGERVQKIMNLLRVPDDEPITDRMVSRSIEGAQKKVESHNFDIRKHLLEYDDVMNKQRTMIYGLRREILDGKNVAQIIRDFMGEVTSHVLDTFADEQTKSEIWDLDGLNKGLLQQFGFELRFEGDLARQNLTSEKLVDEVKSKVKAIFDRQSAQYGDFFEHLKRIILLQTIDQRWKEHLQRVDQIKDGINLRAYAQKDPLVEYKQEAFTAFQEMDLAIKSETIEKLAKVQIVQQAPHDSGAEDEDGLPDATELPEMFGLRAPDEQQMKMSHQEFSTFGGPSGGATPNPKSGPLAGPARPFRPGPSIMSGGARPGPAPSPVANAEPSVGRNDPCPCGSGKKYKKCHGQQS